MTRTSWRPWPLLLAAVLAAACTTWVARLASHRDEIRIPHGRHLELGMGCPVCHEGQEQSTALGQVPLPSEARCMLCHGGQKAEGNCGFCHTAPDAPRTYARREPRLRLDHVAHLERVDQDCTACHTKAKKAGAFERVTPPMSACMECHEHRRQYAEARCEVCHVDMQRYALRPVTAFSHEGNFLKDHERAARASAASCAQCHEQSFCAECHASTLAVRPEVKLVERVDRRFIHVGDFLGRHAMESRADSTTCRKCHGGSFCDSCHRVQGLSAASQRTMKPHPEGFMTPGSPHFHGQAARRDIASCAACHDQGAQSNCVQCHHVGGIGGNPHPPGWSLRHGREEINRNGMCLACHP
jgi:hypothetical protein